MKQVIFKCETCNTHNRQELGCDGFVEQQDEFDSFTDAFMHLILSPSHYMTAEVKEEK